MMKIFVHSLSSLVLLGLCSSLFGAKPLECEIAAPIAILINADNGKILYEKNAHQKCYPASTTKVATLLYTLLRKSDALDDLITVSSDAVGAVSSHVRRQSGRHPSYRLEFGGTHMGLRAGEIMELKTLLYGLMLPSGNDAANVIAQYVSGSVPQFIKEINAFLLEIGCKNTNFRNPHGLPDPHHQTTAYDMAVMARYVMDYPLAREIVKTVRYIRPKTNKQDEGYLVQLNALLKTGAYFYPYATGIKTGYTDHSGYNLVASADNGKRSLIAVVYYCSESSKRYKSVSQLFDAAFQEVRVSRKLLSKEHTVFHEIIPGALQPLDAYLQDDVTIEYYPSEESEYATRLDWHKLPLPIEAGSEVGVLTIYDKDAVVQTQVPLFTKERVKPTQMYKCKQIIDLCHKQIYPYRVYLGLFMGCFLLVGTFLLSRKKDARYKAVDKVE